jgi:tRNA threonylcarbamoyladenosine biosynthesis protein TsaE
MQTHSVEEFRKEAVCFVSTLKPASEATVVALSGELGAGKTTFTQTIAAHLGIKETVTSPTFVIEKVYQIADGTFARLIHIDAYRLKESRELEVLGWRDLVRDPENLILIEWPERVLDLIPESAHRVTLTFIDEDTRTILYG